MIQPFLCLSGAFPRRSSGAILVIFLKGHWYREIYPIRLYDFHDGMSRLS